MASTYTTNLGIEKIGTGEQSGTWGDTTNTNFDILDEAVNGIISVTLSSAGSSGSPTALPITDGASSNGRNKFIEFVDGGDLGGTAYVQLTPNNAEKVVHIRNSLSSSRSVIVFQGTYNASNDFEIVNGADVLLKFNGGGSGATVTDVNVDLTVTAITATTITANTSVVPDASDGATLGSASLEWSDLYLADGAVVFFGDDQDITLTHVADTGLTLKHANTGDDKFPTFLLATGDTDIAASDKLGVINFQAPDEGAGTDAILVAAGIEAVSEGDFSASSNATSLVLKTGASEAATEKLRVTSAGDVGIGDTPSAGVRLDVADTGTTSARIRTSDNSDIQFTFFSNGTTPTHSLFFGDSGNSAGAGIRYFHNGDAFTFTGKGSGAEMARFNSSGNLGIGATTVNRKLELAGNNNAGAKANYLRITDTDTSATAANQQGGIEFYASDSSGGAGVTASMEVVYAGSGGGGEITFNTAVNSGAGVAEAMRIDEAGKVNIGSASNHAGARVVINDTPPTAFGSPMFQVGQETFTTSGIYSIGFGFTNGTYTEPPAEIAAVSTSSSGGTTADIVFGTRSVTTNTAVTERMRLDSNGQIMIQGSATSFDTTAAKNGLQAYYETDTGIATLGSYSAGGSTLMTFHTSSGGSASAEAMRLDSSGNLLVGCTSFGSVSTEGCQLGNSGTAIFSNDSDIPLYLNRTTSGDTASQVVVSFFRNDVQSGTIGVSQGGTPAFGAPSDIRLKENVADHKSELTNVMALRPVCWDWKDSSKGAGEGFVAQELEQTGWADLVSDGEDGYKMVSGLGTVETRLIKALQEAVTRIETLEAEVAALKGA